MWASAAEAHQPQSMTCCASCDAYMLTTVKECLACTQTTAS